MAENESNAMDEFEKEVKIGRDRYICYYLDNKNSILFMQDVLCGRRLLFTIIWGLLLHFLWWVIFTTTLPPLAFISWGLLLLVLFDLAFQSLAVIFKDSLDRFKLPEPRSWKDTPLRNHPVRTFTEICNDLSYVMQCIEQWKTRYNNNRLQSPLKLLIVLWIILFSLSYPLNWVSGYVFSLVLVWCIILTPILERFAFCRARFLSIVMSCKIVVYTIIGALDAVSNKLDSLGLTRISLPDLEEEVAKARNSQADMMSADDLALAFEQHQMNEQGEGDDESYSFSEDDESDN